MPYTHLVRPEYRLGMIRLQGSIYGTDLIHALRSLYSDPAWAPGFSAVWDFRAVTMLALLPRDAEYINRIFEEIQPLLGPPGRTAVLARRQTDRIAAKLILRQRERFIDRPARVFFCLTQAEPGVITPALRQAADWLDVLPNQIAELVDAQGAEP